MITIYGGWRQDKKEGRGEEGQEKELLLQGRVKRI
jgi:hypothetical protein